MSLNSQLQVSYLLPCPHPRCAPELCSVRKAGRTSANMSREEDTVFVLGDILPTYYDAAIAIFRIASKPDAPKMKETINSYAKALVDMWEQSFTSHHVLSRPAVVDRLTKLVSLYYNKVYNKANRTSGKNTL